MVENHKKQWITGVILFRFNTRKRFLCSPAMVNIGCHPLVPLNSCRMYPRDSDMETADWWPLCNNCDGYTQPSTNRHRRAYAIGIGIEEAKTCQRVIRSFEIQATHYKFMFEVSTSKLINELIYRWWRAIICRIRLAATDCLRRKHFVMDMLQWFSEIFHWCETAREEWIN